MAEVENIVITGYGLVSSLGLGALDSCAAAHAGITRAGQIGLQVFDESDIEETPVVGHAVPIITHGFGGIGRLYQMGRAALKDLSENTTVSIQGKTAICVVINDNTYNKVALKKELASIEEQEVIADENDTFNEREVSFHTQVRSYLLPKLVTDAGLSIAAEDQYVLFGSPAQFTRVVQEACNLLNEGKYDCIIIGGIDSLVDDQCLHELLEIDIIKTPDNPVGFMPGEGASFLSLTKSCNIDSRQILARISAVSNIERDASLFDETKATGQAMKDALMSISIKPDQPPPCCCVALNGTEYRSVDFELALTSLASNNRQRNFELKLPVEFFGEMGVVAGPAFTCYALHGILRNPRKKGAFLGGALICLYSDNGERSAFTIN